MKSTFLSYILLHGEYDKRRGEIDVFEAIKGRRSCRRFLPEAIGNDVIETILEAAVWAPFPANQQSWEFIVIRDKGVIGKIYSHAEVCKKILFEKSGWKWIDTYSLSVLREVPVIIAVVGDPEKTGADRFLEGGGLGYHHACAAAIQNMLLAAHELGLGTLCDTLFDQDVTREILGIDLSKETIAMICLGKTDVDSVQTP